MGMTPSVYRRGGGLPIRFAVIKRSCDLVIIAATQTGLCAVLQGTRRNHMIRQLRREFPKAAFVHESPTPGSWTAVVRSSGIEDPFVSRLPAVVSSRIFRAKVLLAQRGA